MSSSNLCPPTQPPSQPLTQSNINTPSSNYFELESQFILRMPLVKGENGIKKVHPAAKALREALVTRLAKPATDSVTGSGDEPIAEDNLKERLFIELNTETRKGRIKFDDEIFEARLVDLPCIIESLKTTDKKMFYKAADICQMLVCRTQDDPWNSSDEEMLSKNANDNKKKPGKKDSDKNNALNKYKWPHGIAAPLKNVRRKRFRKMAKKKIIDYAEIEKEVKQLFRADRDAFKVDYEVILVEGELEDEENGEGKSMGRNNSLNNEDDESNIEEIAGLSDGNSCMDSVLDADSSKLMKPSGIKRSVKALNVDESNMSFIEDDSMMAATTPIGGKSKTANETDAEDGETMNLNNNQFDDNSNSNMPEQSSKSTKHRTGFKDLFVKDVLGDLSSSEEEDDEDNDEDEDEDESKTENPSKSEQSKTVKSFKFNLDKNSIHVTSKTSKTESAFTIGEESNMSGFGEDSNVDFGNDLSESDTSNLDSSKFTARTSNKNKDMPVVKTKNLDILDANSHVGADDTDLDISLGATKLMKADKPADDFNFSDLSSSSNSMDGGKEESNNKAALSDKLNGLMDELQKIQDDRKKLENEIKNINNPVLKAHLSSRLKNLIDEEERKQGEIDEVKTELNE